MDMGLLSGVMKSWLPSCVNTLKTMNCKTNYKCGGLIEKEFSLPHLPPGCGFL